MLLPLAACSEQDAHIHTPKTVNAAISEGILVTDPYVLPPFPGRDVAAGFFEIKNTGPADRLLSVSSPVSDTVEIHNHIEDDGIMRMRRIDSVALETNDVVTFKPGSYHLMMFGVEFEESQKTVDITLNYEKAGSVTLTVPIQRDDDDDETETTEQETHGSASHYGSDTEPDNGSEKTKTHGSGD